MTVAFDATWCGTDLGAYRPCASTYERYPYRSVPPLDATQFTGTFAWFPDPGAVDPLSVTVMGHLNGHLAAAGLALPTDFVTFQTHTTLSQALEGVSATCCWNSLSAHPIPSPVESGANLVRFLNDQQDCVTRYLYLRPGGETFVVHAYGLEFAVDDDETPAYLRPGTFPPYLDPRDYDECAKIYWCAPSFEQFAYRFWIENRLCVALQDVPQGPLSADLEHYLDYYRQAHTVSEVSP